MKPYIATGSAIERLMNCASSVALPHAHFETPYSTRGTALHSYLEELSRSSRDDALNLVDDEWRPACERLNIDGLDDLLSLAAEVALAYNVESDTARELGRGAGRIYDDVTDEEIPCALDVVGVRVLPSGVRRGLVVDWKTGWLTRKKRASDGQLKFGALAAARAFDLDVVEVQMVHLSENRTPWVQPAVLDALDLETFAADIRALYAEAKRLRAEYHAGKMPTTFSMGGWCDYCPAKLFCPAQTRLLRSVMSLDELDDLMRVSPMPDAVAADAYVRLEGVERVIATLRGQIYAIAKSRPLYLGATEDGRHRWLGEVISNPKEYLDGNSTFDVLEELVSAECADEATKVTATKKDVQAAIKKHVPKGKAARTMATFLAEMRLREGVTRKGGKPTIKEFTTKDATPPRALPEGDEADD